MLCIHSALNKNAIGTVSIVHAGLRLPDLADITGFICITTDLFMSGYALCLLSLYVSLSLSKNIYFEVILLCKNTASRYFNLNRNGSSEKLIIVLSLYRIFLTLY